MGKTKLDKAYIFKISIKMRFFWLELLVSKFHFFRVLVTIEPGRSLLQLVTTNCLIKLEDKQYKQRYFISNDNTIKYVNTKKDRM